MEFLVIDTWVRVSSALFVEGLTRKGAFLVCFFLSLKFLSSVLTLFYQNKTKLDLGLSHFKYGFVYDKRWF